MRSSVEPLWTLFPWDRGESPVGSSDGRHDGIVQGRSKKGPVYLRGKHNAVWYLGILSDFELVGEDDG